MLRGGVGETTFGFDRHINQLFYRSSEWKRVRQHVIARDYGCDLGVEGYDIHGLYSHPPHEPTAWPVAGVHGDDSILDPEFLISTTHNTHNATSTTETRVFCHNRSLSGILATLVCGDQ